MAIHTITRMIAGMIMVERDRVSSVAPPQAAEPALPEAALYRLTTWLSPAYPVGAFAYSSGIEWAVEAGDITDLVTLRDWLETVLTAGAGANDAILFAQMHKAVTDGDHARMTEITELAAALVPSRERYLETTTLGRAFVDVTRAAWPCPALAVLQQLWDGPVAYPIAVGTTCAGHGIPLAPAVHVFVAALTANWLSAGMRLIPLGHTDGQRLMQALEPSVVLTARLALAAGLDDLGSATFRADLAGIKHETQYTRLFRS